MFCQSGHQTQTIFSDLPLSLANGYFDNSSLRDLSAEDKQYLNALEVSLDEAQNIEKQTTKQRDCKEWFGFRKGRLTSTKAHRVLIRKRQFANLAKQLTESTGSVTDQMI